ncbi:conserved protein of unknown function,might containing DUF1788 [Shewanella benthica]|uniref:Cytoplasmic protein n=1 Tax=Shewanella benthica TaxID=43661 RepID=A0A330M3N5_9GAMM|nr:DUF1788 domain-containing protein [Shewanella benthica]SQH76708.1 conserved protein of unknown function,might containing DUF1788 [Shewanella benthica]
MVNKFNSGLTKANLSDAYIYLTDVLQSDSFLKMEGLNGDIPFHICPFDPVLQNDVNLLIKQLINYLSDIQVKVLEINLYSLCIEILKEEGDLEWLLENETTLDRDELKEELQGILDIESIITPAITKKMQQEEFQVLIISGVGEVFPYIRSNNILSNLQKNAKDKPTLMFFPGEYKHSLENGASLVLFGKFEDDKYYRAFNILDRAI